MSYFRRAAAALALVAGLALSACSSSGGSSGGGGGTHVTFGYIGDYNGTSLLAIADKQGLWKKHGLSVSEKVFTDGPTQITALGSGDLDYGYIGPGALWLPASGKAKVIAIDDLGNADRVIAQKGITSLAQLKGKKIGYPQGTSGDLILSLALKKAGLTKNDVKLIPMDAPTIVTAFGSGQIDAAGIYYPLIDTIKKSKPDLTELVKDDTFEPQYAFPTAFVSGAKPNTATTKKVVAALRDAMDYRAAHASDSVSITAGKLKLPVDSVKADASHNKVLTAAELDKLTQDGSVDKWLTALNSFFVTNGKLSGPVDPKTYYLGDQFTSAGK